VDDLNQPKNTTAIENTYSFTKWVTMMMAMTAMMMMWSRGCNFWHNQNDKLLLSILSDGGRGDAVHTQVHFRVLYTRATEGWKHRQNRSVIHPPTANHLAIVEEEESFPFHFFLLKNQTNPA
jgi:hypothetical protein